MWGHGKRLALCSPGEVGRAFTGTPPCWCHITDVNLQNCEEEMFVFIKHPVYGTLLRKAEWTKSLGKGRRNYYRYQYIWGTFQKIVLFTSSNPAKQILLLFCRRCSGNVATSSCLANFSCTESRADPKWQMKWQMPRPALPTIPSCLPCPLYW